MDPKGIPKEIKTIVSVYCVCLHIDIIQNLFYMHLFYKISSSSILTNKITKYCNCKILDFKGNRLVRASESDGAIL